MSLTYKGLIVAVLGLIFQSAGIPFFPEKADGAISFILEIAGIIIAFVGRHRKGDVTPLGFYKDK